MVRRRRKKSSDSAYPAWLWMLFGLAIGLSVALAIYTNFRNAPSNMSARSNAVEPASNQGAVSSALDDNGEKAAGNQQPRFTFYRDLPFFEVVIPEQEPEVSADREAQAILDPGVYVLQAGSFSQYPDADRRRAQLALQGIESRIQRVTIDDRTFHRVRIGPIDDLDELNLLRARLRDANIDVLRIRLGD